MKDKKSVLIVVLMILLLCAACFIIYDKFISSEDNKDNTQTTTVTTSEYKYKVANRKIAQGLSSTNINVHMDLITDTKGNAYLAVNTVESSNSLPNDQLNNAKKIHNQMTDNKVAGYIGIDNSDTIESIKLDISNVLSIYKSGMGQYLNEYFFIVKENGDISYIRVNDILEKGEIVIRNIDSIKNVVSVVENSLGEGVTAYAITLDGKEINLVNYLEEYKR